MKPFDTLNGYTPREVFRSEALMHGKFMVYVGCEGFACDRAAREAFDADPVGWTAARFGVSRERVEAFRDLEASHWRCTGKTSSGQRCRRQCTMDTRPGPGRNIGVFTLRVGDFVRDYLPGVTDRCSVHKQRGGHLGSAPTA